VARKAKIEIFLQDPNPQGDPNMRDFKAEHHVRVRAANGEILAVSEGYASKGNARKAAKRLVRTVAAAVIVEVEK
jgi:uncharacterized protein YegP (UPF0339 family)